MSVHLSQDIRNALESRGPVVALETAVLTKGLPQSTWGDEFGKKPGFIEADMPINLYAAKAMTSAVVEAGGIPAWIAVMEGELKIGLSVEELEQLAMDDSASKVSLATIASLMSQKKSAGTTVATTLQACNISKSLCGHAIKVFATGGIGGIHRDWSTRFDISTDLKALASTQTCVVASGAKSILDIQATVESLETLGVPILGFKTARFPCFIEAESETDPKIQYIDSPQEIANICKLHWEQLASTSGVLTTCQVPADVALPHGTLEEVIEKTELALISANDGGAKRTPALLEALARYTKGKSIIANIALLCNNTTIASEIALAISASGSGKGITT